MNTKSPHLDPQWLRQKYLIEGLSTYDIGKLVGRDPKNVHTQLKRFGIPTRPRGLNLKGDDCFMKRPGAVNPFRGRKHSDETKRKLSLAASRPKPWLRGEGNGMSGRTGETNPNFKDGSSPERQRLYASAQWRALLRAVYKRDDYQCLRCGSVKLHRRWLHAHHIRPWAGNPALRFDPSNLVTLCRPCHSWVHSRANTACEYLA